VTAPLSKHTIYVPARQTCHIRAMHPRKGDSIVLTDVAWEGVWPRDDPDKIVRLPREALHLATDPEHKLVPGKTSFTIKGAETVYVEIGNCSDTPLEVGFEIWGKP
jgi:hypothetical protein